MVELTSEERAALAELCEARDSGLSVFDFINQKLYSETPSVSEPGGFEPVWWIEDPESIELLQVYISLAKKGLLEGYRPDENSSYCFEDLTSAGRCYFKDEKAAADAERKKVREQRIHDYKVALFSLLGGAVAGALVSLALHNFFGI